MSIKIYYGIGITDKSNGLRKYLINEYLGAFEREKLENGKISDIIDFIIEYDEEHTGGIFFKRLKPGSSDKYILGSLIGKRIHVGSDRNVYNLRFMQDKHVKNIMSKTRAIFKKSGLKEPHLWTIVSK